MLSKLLIFVLFLLFSVALGKDLEIDVMCESNTVSFFFQNKNEKVVCFLTPSTTDFYYDDLTASVYFIPDCNRETYERTDPYSITCIRGKEKKKIEIMNELYFNTFTTMALNNVKGFYFLDGNESDFKKFLSKDYLFSKRDCSILSEMFLKKKEKIYTKMTKCK